jgi:hypothetical protein
MRRESGTVLIHTYIDDGVPDHRGDGRCVTCGMPQHNRSHQVPDMSEQQDEHRRRVGESEEQ